MNQQQHNHTAWERTAAETCGQIFALDSAVVKTQKC